MTFEVLPRKGHLGEMITEPIACLVLNPSKRFLLNYAAGDLLNAGDVEILHDAETGAIGLRYAQSRNAYRPTRCGKKRRCAFITATVVPYPVGTRFRCRASEVEGVDLILTPIEEAQEIVR